MYTYWTWGWLSYGGVCNSSLKFLPLSSLTFNKEGSGCFASNHFNSLTTWLEFFWSAILIYIMILIVMNLAHGFFMHLNLALVYPEFLNTSTWITQITHWILRFSTYIPTTDQHKIESSKLPWTLASSHIAGTIGPSNYNSFAVAILSQNHREINIIVNVDK